MSLQYSCTDSEKGNTEREGGTKGGGGGKTESGREEGRERGRKMVRLTDEPRNQGTERRKERLSL